MRRIRFDGNAGLFSGQNDLQLRGPLETRASPAFTFTFPFTYFTSPSPLSLPTLTADAQRLEVWYAHHGHFDASFNGWELRRVRDRTERWAGVVDIIGHVEPGPLSLLRTLDVAGDIPPDAATLVRQATRLSTVEVGSGFDLAEVQALSVELVGALQDSTRAFAKAELAVDAYPEQQAVDVRIDLVPGIRAQFGDLRVDGLVRIDEAIVRSSLGFEPGQPFQLRSLRQARQALYKTGLFSLVDLVPDLSDPTNASVPVDVRLVEAKLRRLRFGAGITYDYFNLGPQALVELRDLWLFGSGLRLEAKGGVGAIVGLVRDDEGQSSGVLFTGLGELVIDYPWLLKNKLGLRAAASFRQDAQFGTLPFWRIRAELAARYQFTPAFSLSLGPTFEVFRYLEPSESTLLAARQQFGGDFSGPEYRLLAIDVRLRADYRDDPVRTSRGSFWALDLRQSIPIATPISSTETTPGFLYTRAEGEVRAWWQPRVSKQQKTFPVTLGGRLHAIGLLPWVGGSALPYPDLAFLGGPTSLRAFRVQQVGPYDALCSYPSGRPDPQHNNGQPYNLTRTYLPKGGAFAVEAMAEARVDIKYGVGVAAFGDVGLLANRWPDVLSAGFRGGGGVGLRYDSPVGPIRLDLAFRPLFAEDLAPSNYIGCNPVDRLPRGFDLLTGGSVAREDLANRTFPLGINLYLAIGEAF